MNKEMLKYLVPVVAVLVVVESVVLISKLTKKPATEEIVPEIAIEQSGGVVDQPQASQETLPPVFEVVFGADNKNLKVGEKSRVEVNLLSKGDYELDALSLFIKYDPEAFEVANLSYDERLPNPLIMKASSKAKLVLANFMVTDPGGLKVTNGDTIGLLQFDITPKKDGNFDFEISTSKDSKESATMFVETATSKDLPYSSNKLTVSVTK